MVITTSLGIHSAGKLNKALCKDVKKQDIITVYLTKCSYLSRVTYLFLNIVE